MSDFKDDEKMQGQEEDWQEIQNELSSLQDDFNGPDEYKQADNGTEKEAAQSWRNDAVIPNDYSGDDQATREIPPVADGTYHFSNNQQPRQPGYPYQNQNGNNVYSPMPPGQDNNGYYYNYNYASPASNPPVKTKKKKGLVVFIVILSLAVITSITILLQGIIGDTTNNSGTTTSPAGNSSDDGLVINETPNKDGAASEKGLLTTEQVADKVKPSVVGVLAYSDSTASSAGEGSGVIMEVGDKYSYIITCSHVISGATKLKIQLSDGTQYNAEKVGSDSRSDIAVIRVEYTGLKAAEFGESTSLKAGQQVLAIGNPGGTQFYGSVTSGVISGIDRPISSSIGYTMKSIQHDAAINPGNSGGALVNMYGQVIGINSSKISSANFEGMGFAIPISSAKPIIDDLIGYGYVTNRAKLGIQYSAASANTTIATILQINDLPAGSLIIQNIDPESDLNNTDAKVYDLIVKVNGKNMTDANVLMEVIENATPGDTITLELCRISSDYKVSTLTVKCKLVEDKG